MSFTYVSVRRLGLALAGLALILSVAGPLTRAHADVTPGDSTVVTDSGTPTDPVTPPADPGPSLPVSTDATTHTTVNVGCGFIMPFQVGPMPCAPAPTPVSLTIIKKVVNDDGGTASATDFTVTVNGEPVELSGEGDTASATVQLMPGTYSVSEDESRAYTASFPASVGGNTNACDSSGNVVLGAGGATCYLQNDDNPTTLTIWKEAYGGDGSFDFTVTPSIDSSETVSHQSVTVRTANGEGSTTVALSPGSYNVIESEKAGWSPDGVECGYYRPEVDAVGRPIDLGENITLDQGEHLDCYFANFTEDTGTLVIENTVVNDNGGTASAGDFSYALNGVATSSTSITVTPGFYTVTEDPKNGYATTYGNCSNVEVGPGATVICTITNDDQRTGGGGRGNGSGPATTTNKPKPPATTGGQVLGAQTSCPLIMSFMRQDTANDPAQVISLQSFLNGELNSGLTLNGIFDASTTAAVDSFQIKYASEVLAPWVPFGLSDGHTPTGYVYKLTAWKINSLACPDLKLPVPHLP